MKISDKFIPNVCKLYGDVKVYGPYPRKEDGRRIVIIYKHQKVRITKLYAKVKLEIKLGRILNKDETVDHLDDNVMNDRFSNLQLLTRAANASKAAIKVKPKKVRCIWCKTKTFVKRSQRKLRAGKTGPFCSRKCSGQYGAHVRKTGIVLQDKNIKLEYNK